ncbi:MAG: PorT family protein [Gemmatimonadales bacterium]|nr:PorT family protein [Gemmatimonadales bacterium]
MRKSTILIVMTLMMAVGLVGQAAALPIGPSAGFGLKAGVNLAKMSELEALASGDELSNDVKMGLIGGAFFKASLGPLNAQIEGLYSVKGNQGTVLGGTENWESKLTYFEIPFLLKLELPLPALSPYLYAGPSMAILLKSEELDESTSMEWVDTKDDMASTEWSLAIGGGVNILKFHIDVRYLMGLTELNKENTGTSVLGDSKNRTVSFMVGYDLFSF